MQRDICNVIKIGKLDLYLEETNTKVNEVLKTCNNSIGSAFFFVTWIMFYINIKLCLFT